MRCTKIQFKAYDKYNHKWIEDYREVLTGFYPGEEYGLEHPSTGVNNLSCAVATGGPDQYATMCLYAGLKDKHGREIYNHDLVKIMDNSIVEVIFKNGAFGYELNHFGFIPFAANYNFNWQYKHGVGISDKIEVVGNKFDNPEMLQEVPA